VFFTLLLLFALITLPIHVFKRRIGGAGGGSEPEIVGVLWFGASIFLVFLMFRA
jgi:hypothetical protein